MSNRPVMYEGEGICAAAIGCPKPYVDSTKPITMGFDAFYSLYQEPANWSDQVMGEDFVARLALGLIADGTAKSRKQLADLLQGKLPAETSPSFARGIRLNPHTRIGVVFRNISLESMQRPSMKTEAGDNVLRIEASILQWAAIHGNPEAWKLLQAAAKTRQSHADICGSKLAVAQKAVTLDQKLERRERAQRSQEFKRRLPLLLKGFRSRQLAA